VLRAVPDNADAIRIRDAAAATLKRFDDAMARARDLLAAGDTEGATSALNVARGIDLSSPAVVELSAELVGQLKARAETARREAERSRIAAAPLPQRPLSNPPPAGREPNSAPTPPRPPVQSEPVTAPPAPEPPLPMPVASAPAPPSLPLPQTATPAGAAAETPPGRRPVVAQPPGTTENDDLDIRKTVATYARAIETKDVALFRSVKPNLSAAEQRRLEEGFRVVATQEIDVTILSIEHRGQEATVRLRRRDTIHAAGRPQTSESQQTMILVRSSGGWVIREIGR
jgi:hypothetical protein